MININIKGNTVLVNGQEIQGSKTIFGSLDNTPVFEKEIDMGVEFAELTNNTYFNIHLQDELGTKIKLKGTQQAIDSVKLDSIDGALFIKNESKSVFSAEQLDIYLSPEQLRKLILGGSGECRGKITKEDISIYSNGSGSIELKGNAKQAHLNLKGSSNVFLDQLKCEKINLMSQGSSYVKVHATSLIQGEQKGSGLLEISGNATSTVSNSGSGKIRVLNDHDSSLSKPVNAEPKPNCINDNSHSIDSEDNSHPETSELNSKIQQLRDKVVVNIGPGNHYNFNFN